jgi:hypothetical protein
MNRKLPKTRRAPRKKRAGHESKIHGQTDAAASEAGAQATTVGIALIAVPDAGGAWQTEHERQQCQPRAAAPAPAPACGSHVRALLETLSEVAALMGRLGGVDVELAS